MEYNRIVAVTGMPGLFEVVSSKTDGAIVRSLEDQSTKFVSSRIHNMSHLESIEVYTIRENVQLATVFNAMKNNSTKLPDVKDNKALKSYFEKVYPELDFERVYTSDMKKMIKWYEIITAGNIDFSEKEEVAEETPTAVAEETAPEAPAKKTTKPKAKKTATETTETEVTAEEAKPKKGRKKKTEE